MKSREEYDNTNKTCSVILTDKTEQIFLKKDLSFYQNNHTYFSHLLFKKDATKIREFVQYSKSSVVFNILNNIEFVNEIKQTVIFAIQEKIPETSVRALLNKKINLFANSNEYILPLFDYKFIFKNLLVMYYLNKDVKVINDVVDNTVANVFIDEAQDYTLCELEIIKTIYPNSYFTICGDVNQSNGKAYTLDSWDEFIEYLNADFKSFNTCFRSSKKIVSQFNKRMTNDIYGVANALSDTDDGFIKNLQSITELEELNCFDFDIDSTCLIYINSTTKEVLEANKILSKYIIVNAFDVKGMEFENVVLFDVNAIKNNKIGIKFQYMLISRALKCLVTVQ